MCVETWSPLRQSQCADVEVSWPSKEHPACGAKPAELRAHLFPEPSSGLSLVIRVVNAVICTQWALKKLSQLSLGYPSALKLWDLWVSEAILSHLLQQPRKVGAYRDSCGLGV